MVFLLMLRGSMLTGWYHLLRDPRQLLHMWRGRKPSIGSQDFVMGSKSPKHMSLGKTLESEAETGEGVREGQGDEEQAWPLGGEDATAEETRAERAGKRELSIVV